VRREVDRGFKRLRNSAILATVSSAIFALLSLLGKAAGEPTASILAELLVLAGLIIVAGLAALILSLASWIYKVLGWSDMCRSGIRRFYCVTRLAVLIGPIAGALLILGGVLILSLELITRGAVTPPPVEGYGWGRLLTGLRWPFLAGIILMASANVIEGVAILDIGFLTQAKLLIAGSVVYLISAGLSPLALLSGQLEGLSSLVSIAAYMLLAAGFHGTRWEGGWHEAK